MSQPSPLYLKTYPRSEQDISDALEFLERVSVESSQRFANRLQETLADLRQRLAEQIAQGGRPAAVPDEAASHYFARPTYQHTFHRGTGRRVRRSTAGVWHIYYILTDEDRDGIPDTFNLLHIRHSAARPLTLEDVDEDETT